MHLKNPTPPNYESCIEVCGYLDTPGLALGFDQFVDYSNRETTVDQARIEAVLEHRVMAHHHLLHVGVGNSRLAERFAPRVAHIDGLTISEAEQAQAESLGLPHYRVMTCSKYSRELILHLSPARYDFIIDNNLAGFACCKYHFYLMLDTYLWTLRPGGEILTDQRGMDWAYLDPAFILTFDDLKDLERKFPVQVRKLTDQVYVLQATPRQLQSNRHLNIHALRDRYGIRVVESHVVERE